MATLFADPLGRQLLSLLMADYGLPGDPRREVLLHELQQLRVRAQSESAPRQVRMAIRSALSALRAEFPVAASAAPAVRTSALVGSESA
jgi:hypothetical protein